MYPYLWLRALPRKKRTVPPDQWAGQQKAQRRGLRLCASKQQVAKCAFEDCRMLFPVQGVWSTRSSGRVKLSAVTRLSSSAKAPVRYTVTPSWSRSDAARSPVSTSTQ